MEELSFLLLASRSRTGHALFKTNATERVKNTHSETSTELLLNKVYFHSYTDTTHRKNISDRLSVIMAGLTSASSFLSLLHDPEPEVQVHALNKLDKHVDLFWPEIADSIERMCVLHVSHHRPESFTLLLLV